MTVQALPWAQAPDFESRTCTVTGFRVHIAAQNLIIANAVSAVVFILIGGIMALLVALTRWQDVKLLPPDLFYRFLTAHGLDMLIFWIIFFEIAGLYFGGAIMLNARLITPFWGWVAFALMLAGAVLANVMVFAGQADVMFTSYVPLQANPLYYLGIILFAVGAILAVCVFFATVVMAKVEGRYSGSVPLVTYGLIVAAIIAMVTLLGGAITFIPTFFWSLGLMQIDPEVYRLTFWSIGHPSQQINLAAMVSIWYLLATLTTGAKPLNEKLSRTAFLLYILFINLGSVHHLLTDAGFTVPFKIFNTSYAMYLAVLGSLIHAFSIPGAIEVALRKKGLNNGVFEWLRKGPWSEPGFSAAILSMFIFGFLGGTTGVLMGIEQLAIINHNNLRMTGHFHATVVGGTTLAFMGITYYLLPLMTRRQLVGKKWASIQPIIFAVGMIIVIAGMIQAGAYGAPRRVPDISYAGAPIPAVFSGLTYPMLALMGIGGLLAVAGGTIYVLVAVLTLLKGKPLEAPAKS
jgi:cytochrome c oxidase subunit 1